MASKYRVNGTNASIDSQGEKKIEEFLTKHGMTFEQEKRFKTCRDKKPLPFDFFVTDYNLVIEFDGKQHFKPRHFNAIDFSDSLEYTQFHDELKNNWCEENGIDIIRISYLDFDNIEEILATKLKVKHK
jgi:very-short-patch-repair endonuclease